MSTKLTSIQTRVIADNISRALATRYGLTPTDAGMFGPNLYPGSHEDIDTDWVVSWEEGPYEWVYDETTQDLMEEICNTGADYYRRHGSVPVHSMRVETVAGWGCIALFVEYCRPGCTRHNDTPPQI